MQDECRINTISSRFSQIWFAPHHVRVWRAAFYYRIGRHDSLRADLDDQDLLRRAYICGHVKHFDCHLYTYQIHPDNTCLGGQNAFIQTETLNIRDQHIDPLGERWCDRNALRKIDLCGDLNPTRGYESVDLKCGHITADRNPGWPFGDGEIGVFRAHDALEHLRDPLHTMKESHRCLNPAGWFLPLTPAQTAAAHFKTPPTSRSGTPTRSGTTPTPSKRSSSTAQSCSDFPTLRGRGKGVTGLRRIERVIQILKSEVFD